VSVFEVGVGFSVFYRFSSQFGIRCRYLQLSRYSFSKLISVFFICCWLWVLIHLKNSKKVLSGCV